MSTDARLLPGPFTTQTEMAHWGSLAVRREKSGSNILHICGIYTVRGNLSVENICINCNPHHCQDFGKISDRSLRNCDSKPRFSATHWQRTFQARTTCRVPGYRAVPLRGAERGIPTLIRHRWIARFLQALCPRDAIRAVSELPVAQRSVGTTDGAAMRHSIAGSTSGTCRIMSPGSRADPQRIAATQAI